MQTFFIDKEIKYTGAELAPHWIYKNFRVMGDAACAFIGECEVKLDKMADLEDVINNEPIYSRKMLSIIEENFSASLIEMVYKQRLLVSAAGGLIEKYNPDVKVIRKGDDLFINGRKLSVSIASKSMTSSLIHFGLNIDAQGAPVKASDLVKDAGIKDIKQFALELLKTYQEEMQDIYYAASKVRGAS